MEFSLSAAARATGKGKSAIHNAVRSGKLSAKRTEAGTYLIDASELARVFPLNPSKGSQVDDPEPSGKPAGTELAVLRTKLAMLEDQLVREREVSGDTIGDLRKRLDRAEDRVQALTYQRSDQGKDQAQAPVSAAQPQGLLGRLLGLRRGSPS